jgi:hypothetical protein
MNELANIKQKVETTKTNNDIDDAFKGFALEGGIVDGSDKIVGGDANPTPVESTNNDENNRNDHEFTCC